VSSYSAASACTPAALTWNAAPLRWSWWGSRYTVGLVGVAAPVAPREPPHDARRLAVVQAQPDVERVVVVGHSDLGRLARRQPLVRVALPEAARRQRVGPGGLVQAAVHGDAAVAAHGGQRRGRGQRSAAVVRRQRAGPEQGGGEDGDRESARHRSPLAGSKRPSAAPR